MEREIEAERPVDHEEDRDLARRMLAGDEAAFLEFGERFFAALYRFALAKTRGDRELARELTQATMAKALAKLATYRAASSLLTWLCACFRNELLMHFRSRREVEVELSEAVEHRQSLEPKAQADPGRNPEVRLLALERRGRVHATLEALPGRFGAALEWKYVEHLPVREIADRLGLSAKAAESLLTRARVAFRKTYEELGHA